jgi:hypothetical protein
VQWRNATLASEQRVWIHRISFGRVSIGAFRSYLSRRFNFRKLPRGSAFPSAARFFALSRDNIFSLRSLRTFNDFEFDVVAFVKFSKAFTNDSRIMNKNVGSVVTPDKTITFRIVEPLDHTLHLFRILPDANRTRTLKSL